MKFVSNMFGKVPLHPATSVLSRVRWMRDRPLRLRHARRRWRPRLPRMPAQHRRPLPLPRLLAAEAPARRRGRQRSGHSNRSVPSSRATAEPPSTGNGQSTSTSWSSTTLSTRTNGGERHQQQGRREREILEGRMTSAKGWDYSDLFAGWERERERYGKTEQ